MSNKIAKTIARQKEKIAEGNFYEAHQQLRVITSRYLKANDFTSAASILTGGCLLLLRSPGGSGSGADLANTLINEVYIKGSYPVTSENRTTLLEILHAFPKNDPARKKFITDSISWSCKFGEHPDRGDPELQHEIGVLLANEGDAYEAERHLLLSAQPKSATPLATLHYRWYKLDSPHTAPVYAARSVLPYLVLGNLQSATTALAVFTSQLTSHNPSIPTQSIESAKSSVRIFPSLPLLNFLSLLIVAATKGDSGLFRTLGKHFAPHLKDPETEEAWSDALAQIGEIWFGIKIPRQGGNPLMDMMGSMLFGGGGNAGGGGGRAGTPKPKPKAKEITEKAPLAMDLD